MNVSRSRAVSAGSTAGGASSGGAGVDIPGASTSHASSSLNAPTARTHRERDRNARPKDRHALALRSIRDFLRGRSSYDVLPVSFRLIVLDTKLVVKPALDVMWQAGVVSAPLWQSTPHELLGNSPNQPESESQSQTQMQTQEQEQEQERTQSTNDTEAAHDDGKISPTTRVTADAVVGAKKKLSHKAHQLSGFAGMLTVNDIIHLIQYYYRHSSYDSAAKDVEKFRLERLRDIEQALNVPPPPLLSVHPLRPLFDACQLLIKTHARRLPLLDYDEQTGMETVVSVLTQYRVLKFIAMNCRETSALWRSLRQLNIGTYCQSYRASRAAASGTTSHRGSDASEPGVLKTDNGQSLNMSELNDLGASDEGARRHVDASSASCSAWNGGGIEADGSSAGNAFAPIATATLDTTVFDVVHMFSERGISAVPILDEEGNVVDMYETVDVITLVRTGAYTSLDLTIRQALERRAPDFSGVWTCSPDDSLASIFALLRKRRVHRLLVLEPEAVALKSVTSDQTTALDELDSYVDDLVEHQRLRDKKDTQAFCDNLKTPFELRLEKGHPVRRTRGTLVGIVCLSDILRYVIGEHKLDDSVGGIGTGVGVSRATSIASSTPSSQHDDQHQANGTAHLASASTGPDAPQTIPEHEALHLPPQ